MPRVSVIMAVFNEEKYLQESIDSILKQTYTDFEFIIIDDCSTDNSRQIINSYHDDRIVAVYNNKNLGLTRSLNKAISLANGDYIARQDADDISDNRRIERQIEFMQNNAQVDLVGTHGIIIDEEGQNKGPLHLMTCPDLSDLLESNRFIHGSILANKKSLNRIGGYNELYEYCQDYELFLRLMKNGYILRNIDENLYYFRRVFSDNVTAKNTTITVLYDILAKNTHGNGGHYESIVRREGIDTIKHELNRNEKSYYHLRKGNIFNSYNMRHLAIAQYVLSLFQHPFNKQTWKFALSTLLPERIVEGVSSK